MSRVWLFLLRILQADMVGFLLLLVLAAILTDGGYAGTAPSAIVPLRLPKRLSWNIWPYQMVILRGNSSSVDMVERTSLGW